MRLGGHSLLVCGLNLIQKVVPQPGYLPLIERSSLKNISTGPGINPQLHAISRALIATIQTHLP